MINQEETAPGHTLHTFDDAFERVQARVEAALMNAPRAARAYTQHLAQSRGKFIRAASVLACAESADGLIAPDALSFAAAIELLHLATLVHDDVIDNSDVRRGFPTLQRQFGKHPAVICGDYLFCLALREASDVPDRAAYLDFTLPDYMSRICLGELRQGQNNRNLELSFYQYLHIISGKTAALFEASFYAGAMTCKEAGGELRLYRRLGHAIGMIFQLSDDCIDFEAPVHVAKKPVQSDFEQGVITLPLIYALRNAAGLKDEAAAGRATRARINSAVAETDGLGFTRRVSGRYYGKAAALIERLSVSDAKRDRLRAILEKAYRGL